MEYQQYIETFGQALTNIVQPILKMAQDGIKRADKPIFTALDNAILGAKGSAMETELETLFKNISSVYDCHAANLSTLCSILRNDFKRMR